jgi:exodeoxyribonuclease-3
VEREVGSTRRDCLDNVIVRKSMACITITNDWRRDERDTDFQERQVGDFDIAHADADVHDSVVWNDRVLFSEPERAAFQQLLDLGQCDSFRLFEQPEKSFTWWDYRMNAFRRNACLRIDHVLASKTLCEACTACSIDKGPRGWERPSDHAPVVAEFKI